MFKRVSSVVMVIAMMLTMLCTFSFASAAAPMSLTIAVDKANGEYARGDFVEVTVGVKDYVGAGLLAIKPVVDTDVLKLSLYEGNAEADFTYSAGKIGNPAVVNPTTLYTNWAAAKNFTVLENRVPITTFPILTYYFDIPADAPYGESTISVSFMQKDVNGGVSMAAVPGPGQVNELVAGTDYATEPVSITINIACPADHTDLSAMTLNQPAPGTAEADAVHTYTCDLCHAVVKEEDCGFVSINEPDTCDQPGKVGVKCAVCNYEISQVKDDITDHDWKPDGLDAKANGKHVCANNAQETENCTFGQPVITGGNCTEDLVKTYTCTVCGYTYTETTTAPGHELESNGDGTHSCKNCDECDATCNYTKDVGSSGATCQIAGTVTKECECGDQKTIQGAMKEHVYGAYTENGDGTHSATCTTCDPAVATPAVDTEDCDYEVFTAADCENAGTLKCKVCGHTIEDPNAPATNHSWGAWTHVEDTETHTRTCGNANCPVGTQTEECDGTPVYHDPTCEDRGYTTVECDDCGEIYTTTDETEDGDPTGHNFDGVSFTYTGDDDETHTHSSNGPCANGCGTMIVDEPCEWQFVNGEPACGETADAVCIYCGHEAVVEGAAHEMVTLYKPTTAEEGGFFQDTCSICGYVDWRFYETEAGEPFKDISSDDIGDVWFVGPANFCYTYGGLMIGEYGNFNAGSEVTRGQIVTVLGRLWLALYGDYFVEAEMYELGDAWLNGLTDPEFADLLEAVADNYGVEAVELGDLNGAYFDRYALLLANMGVVMGRDDGNFDGWAKVTRAELATFMARFIDAHGMKHELADAGSEFSDIASCGWATDYVEYVGEIGLFAGDDAGKFNPWQTANRGQLATLLERLVRAMEWYEIVDFEG